MVVKTSVGIAQGQNSDNLRVTLTSNGYYNATVALKENPRRDSGRNQNAPLRETQIPIPAFWN
jgi:hypothetical protein